MPPTDTYSTLTTEIRELAKRVQAAVVRDAREVATVHEMILDLDLDPIPLNVAKTPVVLIAARSDYDDEGMHPGLYFFKGVWTKAPPPLKGSPPNPYAKLGTITVEEEEGAEVAIPGEALEVLSSGSGISLFVVKDGSLVSVYTCNIKVSGIYGD